MKRTHFTVWKMKQDVREKPYLTSAENMFMRQINHFFCYVEHAQVHEWNDCGSSVAAAKSLQSCPTLCDPIDGSPPGSPIPGTLQARTLEWAAISFSNAWKWKVRVKSLSHVWLFVTPWTAAHQAPLSMGFPRQEYWSGVQLPSVVKALEYWF